MPSGRQLVISVTESAKFKLFRVPLEGGPGQEIATDGSIPLMGWWLSPGALSADGRILALHDGLRSTLWKFHPDSNP